MSETQTASESWAVGIAAALAAKWAEADDDEARGPVSGRKRPLRVSKVEGKASKVEGKRG